MGVIFNSTIKMDDNLDWYIELVDTIDGRLEVCKTLDEYSSKIEQLGAIYGGNVDEVKWLRDENVTPHAMDEIRQEMLKIDNQINKDKEQ
jgi:hypothetical protein